MIKCFLIFLCSAVIVATSFAQTKKNANIKTDLCPFPVIDMHFHSDWWGHPGLVETLSGLKAANDRVTYVNESFKYLNKYNIVRAVTDGKYTQSYQQKAPGQIIPSHVSFGIPIDTLRQWYKQGKYAVMGEFEPQYKGISPDDKILEPYYALAEELDVPMGMHIGLGPPGAAYMPGTEKYRMSLSNPLLLENVLVKHPKLRLYVMHGGWPFLDEMVGLMYAHPQVYIDIAVINWVLPRKEFHQYLRRLVEAGFTKRIMYGSDEMQWPQSIAVSIENIRSADFLTNIQKQDILYNNAARFLRLSDDEIKKDKSIIGKK